MEGGPVRALTRTPTAELTAEHGIGALVTLTSPEEIRNVQLAGGSGYGGPLARPVDEVQHDLDHGYVSPAGAERYGCALGPDGRIDETATTALRAPRRENPSA